MMLCWKLTSVKNVLLDIDLGESHSVEAELDAAELDNVILEAGEKCPALAHKLFQTVMTTQRYEYFWSAVTKLAQLKAYGVLVKCLAVDKAIRSDYFKVSPDHFIISINSLSVRMRL